MQKQTVIIYYHEVVEDSLGYSYQKIGKSLFEEQMSFLASKGFCTYLFSELEDIPARNAIAVTFDDGFRSVFDNAFPIMKKYGIKGNVYLTTGYVGKDAYLTWQQIEEMRDSGLFDFVAHSHSHPDFRYLSKTEMIEEFKISDECFLQHNIPLPDVFCIPFGAYNYKAKRYMFHADRYTYILASYYGFVDFSIAKKQRKLLPRIGIKNEDSLIVFEQKITGTYNWKGPLQRVKLILRNISGERLEDAN